MTELDFFEQLTETFERQTSLFSPVVRTFKFGCGMLKVSLSGPNLDGWIMPALEHLLHAQDTDVADLTVLVWESAQGGLAPPSSPWGQDRIVARGEIKLTEDSPIRAAFSVDSGILYVYHPDSHTAVVWLRDAGNLPAWEHAAPLRALLGWWAEQRGCQLAHGAGVGNELGGVLLAARGGSGKSTTALAALQAGMRYLGDDYVLLRPGKSPFVCSLYNSAKLVPKHFKERLPGLLSSVVDMSEPHPEKLVAFLNRTHRSQMVKELPLRAIVVPHVSPSGIIDVQSLSGAKALSALAPTTLYQLPGAGARAFARMAELVKIVPTYSLAVGPDLDGVVQALTDLLRETSAGAPHDMSHEGA